MEFGCAFASTPEAAQQAWVAESLGFDYIGFYDSPALETDVWLTIAEALRSTQRIRVGTYVLIPHLRTPITQASAIATLWQRAPGRLEVAMGTGFTGRMAMGKRPLSWAFMERFIGQLRALLAGEEVEIDGAVQKLIRSPNDPLPEAIDVPLFVAGNGPKGIDVAKRCGDGLVYYGEPERAPGGFDRLVLPLHGFALEDGESATSPRLIEAARVMFTLQYHLFFDGFSGSREQLDQLPYGRDWLATIEQLPERTRHLRVHEGHMTHVNAHDRAFSERHRDALEAFARESALTPGQLGEQIDSLKARGATRIIGGHALPDWERGLRAFAAAAGLG
ncbi:MAG: LLM class flavin-dependent oxidoreductase [bacterium]|nr:5,10-methylene tetrahydromethanopterin reductase [Deltaproteobacteria bacterium]MCP4906049.1 LLM class flavin-dependent oxidoreductase [bacterium]